MLSELPPRTEIVLPVELSEEETALYESLRRDALERIAALEAPQNQKQIQILAEMMKLRRACCNPLLVAPDSGIRSSKLEAFARLVDELLENRHKALVFSQFVDHLTLIRRHLDERGIRYQYLDGATPMQERKRRVDAFQAGDGDLFLISLKAGGVGINLTAADYVIHMDPWWNPAVEDQASDRAHRMGQQRPVTIYRLVARHTIEEGIVDLHRHKRDLADSLLEGSDVAARMSPGDMLAMLQAGPDAASAFRRGGLATLIRDVLFQGVRNRTIGANRARAPHAMCAHWPIFNRQIDHDDENENRACRPADQRRAGAGERAHPQGRQAKRPAAPRPAASAKATAKAHGQGQDQRSPAKACASGKARRAVAAAAAAAPRRRRARLAKPQRPLHGLAVHAVPDRAVAHRSGRRHLRRQVRRRRQADHSRRRHPRQAAGLHRRMAGQVRQAERRQAVAQPAHRPGAAAQQAAATTAGA